tara:strand:- start:2081 stop:3154 length:1074 start_codon:yes stop_codon:yes gene_type:complete
MPGPNPDGYNNNTNNGGNSSFNASAEDWNAIGTGLSTFGSGMADWFTSQDQIKTQEGFQETAQFDIDQFMADAAAGKYDALTNQKQLDAYSVGRRATDTTDLLSQLATQKDVYEGDPRASAANYAASNTSAIKALEGTKQRDFQNEYANAQGYGQYMGGLQGKNEDFQRGLATNKYQTDQLAVSTAQQNIEQLRAAKAAAPYNMLAGGIEAGLGIYGGFAEDGMKIPEYQDGGDVMQQILSSQGQEGAVPPRQDLPGEEDHESNPISMVAENGEVVGEATGGEIILNGEQTEEIENAVAMVDQAVEAGGEPPMEELMALYEAVSGVLSQPQFQDGQQESSSPEQDNMMAFLEGQQMA